eukprot:74572-Prorocentrum_minimum.AAC.1
MMCVDMTCVWRVWRVGWWRRLDANASAAVVVEVSVGSMLEEPEEAERQEIRAMALAGDFSKYTGDTPTLPKLPLEEVGG